MAKKNTKQEKEDKKRREFEGSTIQHTDALYKAALKMTRNNGTEAEDLVQDTFERAYKFFDKFKQNSSAKAWLLKILKNIYFNKYRKEAKKPRMVTISYAEVSGELTNKATPEDEVIGKLLNDDIAGAIGALPEEFRACVVMADIEGFSYREICEILDIPIGTVMSRLHRGRALLKKALYEYAKEHDI